MGTAKPWLRSSLVGMQGDHTAHPTAGNYTFKVALEEQNTTYNLDLCPSQLKQVRLAPPRGGPRPVQEIVFWAAREPAECLVGSAGEQLPGCRECGGRRYTTPCASTRSPTT